VKSGKTGEVSGLSGVRGANLARAALWLGRHIRAGHGPNLVAEADGNRTRPAGLAAAPVLKFGDGRATGCYLVPPHAIPSRSNDTFVLSGAIL
jgi:hypothetical protein